MKTATFTYELPTVFVNLLVSFFFFHSYSHIINITKKECHFMFYFEIEQHYILCYFLSNAH